MKEFEILFLADEPDGRCFEKTGRLPSGAYMDADEFLYSWTCKASRLGTAIRRAVKRCEALRNRTGLDWHMDEEIRVGRGTSIDFVYVGNDPVAKEFVR